MDTVASQITSLTTVYSNVEFPAQMASNAENVSIWWRHHERLLQNRWDTRVSEVTLTKLQFDKQIATSVYSVQQIFSYSTASYPATATVIVLEWNAIT